MVLAGDVVPPRDEDGTQCSKHMYLNNNSSGGICAICLQDKLGKLVSSSSLFKSDPFPSPTSLPLSLSSNSNSSADQYQNGRRCDVYYSSTKTTKSRSPFLLISSAHKDKTIVVSSSSSESTVLKRSNSTIAPRSGRYLPSVKNNTQDRRRGFWSFLHQKLNQPKALTPPAEIKAAAESISDGNNTTAFGGQVSKSRSVSCGSRSFSGDFMERISTGLGDCTLRRVESTREGKRPSSVSRAAVERVRCGGLFGGFAVSSSSSSSSDRVSHTGSMTEDPRPEGPAMAAHGRSKSWVWSPMRAFGKPSSTRREIGNGNGSSGNHKMSDNNNNNSTRAAPNLAAIPSLLSVRG